MDKVCVVLCPKIFQKYLDNLNIEIATIIHGLIFNHPRDYCPTSVNGGDLLQ